MGQVLKTLASGNDEKKVKEIGPVIQHCYETHLQDTNKNSSADFYRAVCDTVEEINMKLGSAQFRMPSIQTLEEAYKKHNLGKGKKVTKEEFQEILKEIIMGSGFTGIGGVKEVLLYVFGVPLTALFIKQRIAPKAIPNDLFIPAVTSATVFLLAQLNKI